jgi:hypothetical protein
MYKTTEGVSYSVFCLKNFGGKAKHIHKNKHDHIQTHM